MKNPKVTLSDFFYFQLKILFLVKYPVTKRVVLVHEKLNKLVCRIPPK